MRRVGLAGALTPGQGGRKIVAGKGQGAKADHRREIPVVLLQGPGEEGLGLGVVRRIAGLSR